MPHTRVRDTRLFFDTHGSGSAVLFIHGGYGGPATTLLPQPTPPIAGALQSDFLVLTYDRRCSGRSDYSDASLSLDDLAADAVGLLDALDIERAIIVGSSAGGPIALQFALSWPERVTALALPNTGAALMTESPAGIDTPYSAAIERRLERVRHFMAQVEGARSMGDRAYFDANTGTIRDPAPVPGSSALPQDRATRLREALASASDDELFGLYIGMLRNYEAYAGVDLTARLAELAMPTFIVHGDADRAVPLAYGNLLHERIAGSEVQIIEGAEHGILSYPQAREALRDWAINVTREA